MVFRDNRNRVVMVCLGVLLGVTGAARAQVESPSAGQPTAITQPSEKRKLSFYGPGIIKDVPVKEGTRVKVGQELMSEDDRIEQAALESVELQANSVAEIRAAEAELANKKVTLARKERMHKERVASDDEVEQATLEVLIAGIKVDVAREQKQAKLAEAKKQKLKVELMHLLSPIDGIVERIEFGSGETVDPAKPAILVVKTDPLWVEVHLSAAEVAKLREAGSLEVAYPGEFKWMSAKVIFVSQVDAASDTQLVRMELPNPEGRVSGLQMLVKLPAKVAAGQ